MTRSRTLPRRASHGSPAPIGSIRRRARPGTGPIKQDPDHPYVGNVGAAGRQVTPRLGNYKDPVLKPWAAKIMRESNEEVLSGKRAVGFAAQARCYPGGVPGQLLYPAEPMYFIQTPKEVWMIWQRDHMVRRVYLTDRHSETVKPSWFGESIGRYDNGELVVDTIGLSTKNSYIDNLRIAALGKGARGRALQTIRRRPDAARLRDRRGPRGLQRHASPRPAVAQGEERDAGNGVRAENNIDPFHQNLFPLPEADKPDF